MFLNFFIELRNVKVPVSLREYLSLLDCLDKNVISFKVENFYYLSRASLIKNEKHIDRFDLVFSKVFKGIEDISLEDLLNKVDIPKEWVKKLSEKLLTPEEMDTVYAIESLKAFKINVTTVRIGMVFCELGGIIKVLRFISKSRFYTWAQKSQMSFFELQNL